MLNFHRAAVLLLPSVPRRLARLVDVAAQTPVPVRLGEERAGTGPDAASTSLGVGSRPGSAVPWHPAAFSGPPPVETLLSWSAHPAHRWEFNDTHLAALLGRWTQETP